MISYFLNLKQPDLVALSKEEYNKALIKNIGKEEAFEAFKRAWETRNFEIEMYWKRATYFWAFIASTFAGYFAVSNADNPDPDEIFILICIGLILSMAWLLTNIGSKIWQRHWETHVDLLEDQFTGPLYKIVYAQKTFSVSKINEIVSAVFVFIWILLGYKFYIEHGFNDVAKIAIAFVVLASSSMIFGHGRGRFGERKVQMYRRKIFYKE